MKDGRLQKALKKANKPWVIGFISSGISLVFGALLSKLVPLVWPNLFDPAHIEKTAILCIALSMLVVFPMILYVWSKVGEKYDDLGQDIKLIAATIGTQASFQPIGAAHEDYTLYIRRAKRSVIAIIDYVYDWEGDRAIYDDDPIDREARRHLFEAFSGAADRGARKEIKYQRVVQAPSKRQMLKAIPKDPIYYEHCCKLVEASKRGIERAALRWAKKSIPATFYIIDGEILLLYIDYVSPDKPSHNLAGAFIFRDPTGESIAAIADFADRVIACSEVVTSMEIEVLPTPVTAKPEIMDEQRLPE